MRMYMFVCVIYLYHTMNYDHNIMSKMNLYILLIMLYYYYHAYIAH